MAILSHRKTAKKINTPGHIHFLTFSCHNRLPLLTNPEWNQWLADAVRRGCDSHRVALWAYVFMPEHVHLLLKPRIERYELGALEKSIKLSVSKRVINSLISQSSPLLEKMRVRERPGKWCYRFWQEGGGHDKNIWSIKLAGEKAIYCHANPVKRRLVSDPSHWWWSSFRWLEAGQKVNEPLVVDDWDESLLASDEAEDGPNLG